MRAIDVDRIADRRQLDRVRGRLIPSHAFAAVDRFDHRRRLGHRRRRRRLLIAGDERQ
jgi:hypothetical protein